MTKISEKLSKEISYLDDLYAQRSSPNEIENARGTFTSLDARLDDSDATLTSVNTKATDAQTKANSPLNQISDGTITSSKFKTLNESDRIGLANLKQEVIQSMAGTTAVNQIPADKSVTPKKTSFFETGKNLFDKSAATLGYVVNEATGAIYANATYDASDYIDVLSSTAYTASNGLYLAFYDSSKVFVSGLGVTGTPTSPRTFTTPATATYVRLSCYASGIDTFQVELGNVATGYEAYKQFIPKEILEDKPLDVSTIPLNSIDALQTKFIKTGKNLFDKSTVTVGYYVNDVTGQLSANASYDASDYIPVDSSTAYTESHSYLMAFYDENKSYISGLPNSATPTSPRTFTTPATATYVRVSIITTYLNAFQVEKGSIATGYEAFNYYLDKSLTTPDEFLLFLPPEICVAVGRTIELYNSQVSWCGNINNYHFKWDCVIGKALKRKFSITGTTELIGEYALTLTVYDNNMNGIASATTTIKIISATISAAKNILTIGDSLTNNKPWLGELRTLSSNQFTMVGTRGTAPLKHEGRSGFSAASYLAGTAYTYESEGVHPFWDGTRFNWNYYKTQTGLTPNAVQIYLGTNGMTLDATINANNIKQIVDYIRQDDATIPIFLIFTLYRGNQDGIGNEVGADGYAYVKGSWKLEEDRKVFNLMKKLSDLLSSYTNLHFVPISLEHDSEYNFGAVSTPVNPRASQTELLPSEGTHPQQQGYYQMADIMFSVMAKYIAV